MWLVGLPLDWQFNVIAMVVTGFASSIVFYDRNAATRARQSPEILMQNVHWNFATTAGGNINDFIAAVTAAQDEGCNWNPDQRIAVQGRLEILFALYHRDGDKERRIILEPSKQMEWTQGSLLHALHQSMDVASLGDHTFFEGLARSGDRRFLLLLGS